MYHFYLLLIVSTSALAQEWVAFGPERDGEITGDNSGRAIALSEDGNIVVIGATGNNKNGNFSGHVRIYEHRNGSWSQLGEDINGEAAFDYFGHSVALSADGSIVAIGATGNDKNGINSGHARIYEHRNGTWSQLGEDIVGETAGDHSGRSVALSADGTIVAIGATENCDSGIDSGHVRIFQYSTGDWAQLGEDIDGEAAFDYFGNSVALSSDGSIVAIGATGHDGNGGNSGQVQVYAHSNGNWSQLGKDIDGETAFNYFGSSVSLSATGSIVAVGATGNNAYGTHSGHVRIYEHSNGSWSQLGSDIDGEAAWDESGGAVSLSSDGNTVAIGTRGSNWMTTSAAGHVRIYKNSNDNWSQLGADLEEEAESDYFGHSVALSADGSIVATGATGNTDYGSYSGHALVFDFYYTDPSDEVFNPTEVCIYTNSLALPQITTKIGRKIYPLLANGKQIRIDIENALTEESFTFGPYGNPDQLIIDHLYEYWYRITIYERDHQASSWDKIFEQWMISSRTLTKN